jgi:hypothetical protein
VHESETGPLSGRDAYYASFVSDSRILLCAFAAPAFRSREVLVIVDDKLHRVWANTVRVPQNHTNLRRRQILLGELADVFLHLGGRNLQPNGRLLWYGKVGKDT